MKIELRNIKYASFASEETACFEATVLIDGERAGTVRNDGHGGCHFYYPPQLESRVSDHAATLPKYASEEWGEGFSEDAKKRLLGEQFISELVEAYLLRRDYKRLVGSKVLFLARDGKLYESKKVPKARLGALIEQAKGRADVDKILNLLPEEEGFAIYAQQTGGAQP
jgi:hypothetical protein